MVALLNYSVVQSLIGAAIGNHFSKEWGGTVKVGSVHIDPFNHLSLRNVLLVSPDGNDTVFRTERLGCRFRGLPIAEGGIRMRSVVIHNAMFHLTSTDEHESFKYIADYFRERNRKKEKAKKENSSPFVVDIKDVVLDNVCYRMTLDTIPYYANRAHGVDVANMEMDSVCAHITNLRVVNDHVICHIVKMSTVERSGWRMIKLAGDVDVSGKGIHVANMQLHTNGMNMLSDVHLVYDSWKSLDWYCDSVYMDVTFKKGNKLSMLDAAYWAPSLWGCDDPVYIEGHVTGPVSNLRVADFNINFGRNSHLNLDGTVCGLPYIEGTFFDMHLRQLRTNIADLLAIHHPGALNIGSEKLYDELGTIDLTADLLGGANKCNAFFDIHTALGDIQTTAKIGREASGNQLKTNVTLSSDNIELPSLAKNEWVSHTGFDISIDAIGSDIDNLKAKLDAKLKNTILLGNSIDRTALSAKLNKRQGELDLIIDDPVIGLSANGAFSFPRNAAHTCQLDLDLNNADLRRLKLLKCDSLGTLTAHIQADLDNIDKSNPTGTASIKNLVLRQDDKAFRLDNAHLEASDLFGDKEITLTSDLADISAKGHFNYSNIPLIAKKISHDYAPIYWKQNISDLTEKETDAISSTYIYISVNWKDRTKQIQFFQPNLDISPESTIDLAYNYRDETPLDVVFGSKSITLGNLALHNITIITHSLDSNLTIGADILEMTLNAKNLISDLHLKSIATDENVSATLRWYSDDKNIINSCSDSITIVMHSDPTDNSLTIREPYFFINGERWTLHNNGTVNFNKERIDVSNLTLTSGDQNINIDYYNSKSHTNDSAHAQLTDFNLSTLSDLVTKNSGFNASGKINGDANITWSAGGKTPTVTSDMTIDDCMLNQHRLGDIKLIINHNVEKKLTGIFAKTELAEDEKKTTPLNVSCIADFNGSQPSLNLFADFSRFDLVVLGPLLKSFSSKFEGYLTGNITMEGTLKDPKIKGIARVDDGLIHIDATNVAYRFNDTIGLDYNRIRLNDFTLHDANGNPAYINGNIDYKGFSNIYTNDLELTSPRLLVYNNHGSSSAKGTVYAKVKADVRGTFPSLDIKAEATTLNGSRLTIPITSQRNISNSDYITFVSDDYEDITYKPVAAKKNSNISANISATLNATPDLELKVPMDMSAVSLDIGGKGNGTITATLMPRKDIQVSGDYRITDGSIVLNLLSLVTKKFEIENGSTVEFPGNINNARFNVNAIYSVRVDVNPLLGEDENSAARRPVDVNSVVSLKGDLTSPKIDFGIRMPNADPSLKEEVFAKIDTTNDNEKLNQTLYLLVNGKFYSNQSDNTNNTNLAASGISLVANSLGSMVSSMIEFVDVNFDYTAANGTRGDQYSVGINKHWDKFYIESTLGYGGYDQTLGASEALANNIVGDILLGYTFNEKLHMFIFNRSNTNDYTRFEMPYKQGLGLKYTRDFDKWSELFKRKGKKNKVEQSVISSQ